MNQVLTEIEKPEERDKKIKKGHEKKWKETTNKRKKEKVQ
jgi:hypothetical protein